MKKLVILIMCTILAVSFAKTKEERAKEKQAKAEAKALKKAAKKAEDIKIIGLGDDLEKSVEINTRKWDLSFNRDPYFRCLISKKDKTAEVQICLESKDHDEQNFHEIKYKVGDQLVSIPLERISYRKEDKKDSFTGIPYTVHYENFIGILTVDQLKEFEKNTIKVRYASNLEENTDLEIDKYEVKFLLEKIKEITAQL